MNWLRNFVRPKIQAIVRKKDVPENLWETCSECGQMIFHRDLEGNLRVCPECGFHMRLHPEQRLKLLFDEGEYKRIELPEVVADPLKFRDKRRYSDRLRDAQSKTGESDAIVVAHGRIGGINTVIAAFNFDFLGGSMGTAVGEGLVAAARLAVLQESPFVIIPASGGARMQEGVLSLMQMARTTVAIEEVREMGLPYVVILTNPTTGGVTASFAMLGDLAIAEPGAIIGFAGARVIETTIRESLPEGFQRSEYLLEHGMIDLIVPRPELRDTLARVLGILSNRGPVGELVPIPRTETTPPRPD